MNHSLLFLVVFDIRWLQLCLELFAGFNFVVFLYSLDSTACVSFCMFVVDL